MATAKNKATAQDKATHDELQAEGFEAEANAARADGMDAEAFRAAVQAAKDKGDVPAVDGTGNVTQAAQGKGKGKPSKDEKDAAKAARMAVRDATIASCPVCGTTDPKLVWYRCKDNGRETGNAPKTAVFYRCQRSCTGEGTSHRSWIDGDAGTATNAKDGWFTVPYDETVHVW